MSAPRLAAVLHGARWPTDDAGAAWRQRLSRALQREVDIVLARDEPGSPRGAAACIADALGRTMAPHVLVADVHATPDDETLQTLVAALTDAALVVPTAPPADRPAVDGDRWSARLRAAAAGESAPRFVEAPVWTVQREAVIDAGGLDAALWSYGTLDDLAVRLTRIGAP
ncbi:MAG TPA: hypothetical protein VMF13_15755, partial [Luteitalea sp.]|nr:hypothetical protein [Luteitalea sp.]